MTHSAGKRYVGAFVATLVILAAVMINSWRSTNNFIETSQLVDRSRTVIEALDFLFADIVNVETGERGFVITGDESYLEPYLEARNKIPHRFEQIRALMDGAPEKSAKLDQLSDLVQQKVADADQIVTLRRTQGVGAATAQVALGEGKRRTDQIRKAITELRNAEYGLLGERAQNFAFWSRRTPSLILVASSLAIIVIALSVILIRRDVNRRRTAETARKEAEERYRGIFENSLEGIFQTTPSGQFIAANPALARLLGYDNPEMMITQLTDIAFEVYEHQADREDFKARLLRDGALRDFEVQLRRRDGSLLWANVNARVIRGDDGKPQFFEGSITDVTERRDLQEQLVAKNRELREQNRRVEEASRLKTEFLANMSHELRTPLNGIIGFSEIMIDERIGPVSAEHKEFLTDILNSARHLLQLINDVLDLSKIEAGKMEFRPSRVSLPRLVGEVRDVQRSHALRKRIAVESEISGLDEVYVDEAKLKQILYNYTSNALKFTPEGGRVMIRIEAEDEAFFLLEVEDSGIGIKSEDIPKLFVEFRQLDEGSSKKYQGTGLGLALTRRIAEAQGGRVGVRSVPGKGSTFWALLPRHHAPVVEERITRHFTPAPLASSGRSRRGSVLIVDDDPAALKMMEKVFDRCGYLPVCEPTAGGALKAAEREKPILIVLDLMMPGMDGFAFLERFRRLEQFSDVPIVVWTAKELTDADIARLQGWVQGIVSKERGGAAPLIEELKQFLPEIEDYVPEKVR